MDFGVIALAATPVITGVGIWLSYRVQARAGQTTSDHLDYDQMQEDLASARADAAAARNEAVAASERAARILAEQVNMRHEYEAQRDRDRRELAWRDRYIATLTEHIWSRRPPPPPAKPEGISQL